VTDSKRPVDSISAATASDDATTFAGSKVSHETLGMRTSAERSAIEAGRAPWTLSRSLAESSGSSGAGV
jgi:hypothetical protein